MATERQNKAFGRSEAVGHAVYLAMAAAEAEPFVGATSPNPPVGALLVKAGRVLAAGAHRRAGSDHAEVDALKRAVESGHAGELKGATLYVTLEPCNHFGRTPPCTRAILEAGIAKVVIAERDPNAKVAGGGAASLRAHGVEVEEFPGHEPSRALIDGFATHCRTGRPWVVVKRAFRFDDCGALTSIPQDGARTFTSPDSLTLAHRYRRRSDAIITGIETVLADKPQFTVRRVKDHAGKKRIVVILSRTGRMPPADWLREQTDVGHEVVFATSPARALEELGARGALRALIEAGPTVSAEFEKSFLWDERLVFVHRPEGDLVYTERAQ